MKVKFLNSTIEIIQSDRPLPYPFYDVNYAYRNIIVSSHISLTDNIDKDRLNEIILKGCIDIVSRDYMGLNNKANPVYDYIISKINITDDVYTIEDNIISYPYKEE